MVDIFMKSPLTRALNEGVRALPEDLGQLVEYLRFIEDLLREKAQEHEPNWDLVEASGAEIETLQRLEATVVDQAVLLRADTLEAVLLKFEIWRGLGQAGEGADGDGGKASPRDRLMLSAEADLVRLARGRPISKDCCRV